MKGQQIITCTNCGENKVKDNTKSLTHLFIWLGVISTIFIITIPLAVVFFISAIVVKVRRKNHRFTCQSCKHTFEVSKNTFEEYERYLKA